MNKLILGVIAASLAVSASAETGNAVSDNRHGEMAGDAQSGEPGNAQAAVSITFSRAPDLSGQKPTYFSRSGFSGLGTEVSFSSRKPVTVAVFSGSLPTGMPVAARGLTSGFGMRAHPLLGGRRAHQGIDLAAAYGTPIVATSDGTVSAAEWRGGYGLYVSLEHGGGLQTRYGHMSRLNVAPGQRVHKGDIIGLVGSTGLSTGPHLHYEMRINGQAVNPVLNSR